MNRKAQNMIFINLYIHVHVALEAQFSPYTKSMHKAQKSSIVQNSTRGMEIYL